MLFCRKSKKIQAINITLDLLAGFHAVPLDNPAFVKQYRHIFSLLSILKGQKNV